LRQKDPIQVINQRLTEAATNDPDLAGYYEFQGRLLQRLHDTKTHIAANLELVDQEALETLVRQGSPLLSFPQLPIEVESFASLATAVTQELVDYYPELNSHPRPTDAAGWSALAAERFNERQASATKENSAPDLSQLATDLALKPYLEWAAERILSHLNQDHWKHPYCPVCGGAPDFAVLTEETGARKLVCSRCNSLWSYRRLGCPFCETTEFAKISYYASEDEVYRLYTCENCHRYLKTIDLRKSKRRMLIDVERVTTIDLDISAREEGYT
jgi:formate dehydrogenase maturation protein FdhE